MSEAHKDKDHLSGVETTGHEWDGIKELNNPAPRWWLWVFYATIVWAIGYMVIYPSWPTLTGEGTRGGTEGALGWTQYKKLAEEQAEITARRSEYLGRFEGASFEEVMNDPELYAFANAGGASAFKDNCATCHGTGGAGGPGYPNLNDDDWIWGGSMEAIYHTLLYGIRADHEDTHSSMMPAYGDMFSDEELREVASYVHGLSEGKTRTYSEAEIEASYDSLPRGVQLFADNCASCHGYDAKGLREFGAPNLADAIWLKSEDGSVGAIMSQLRNPQHGVMPAWIDRLDDHTIRQLTVYVHSLGGGE